MLKCFFIQGSPYCSSRSCRSSTGCEQGYQNEAESDSGADNLLVIPDDYDWEDRLGLGKSDKKSAKREKKSAKEDKKSAKREKEEKQYKLTRPIGVKLIGITSAIIVISMALVTFVVSYFITADTRINAEENNLTINKITYNAITLSKTNQGQTVKVGDLYGSVFEGRILNHHVGYSRRKPSKRP